MDLEKSWEKFYKSGKVEDYLAFVNTRKENELINGTTNPFYNRGLGYQGDEHR